MNQIYNELTNLETNKDMGYVYALYNPKSNLVKIGKTKSPQHRFSTLTNQNGTSMHYYLSPAMFIESIVEKVMHNKFDRYREKGEWFRCDFNDVVNTLDELINSEDSTRRNIKH